MIKTGELISFWQFENYANVEPHFEIDEGRNANKNFTADQ